MNPFVLIYLAILGRRLPACPPHFGPPGPRQLVWLSRCTCGFTGPQNPPEVIHAR